MATGGGSVSVGVVDPQVEQIGKLDISDEKKAELLSKYFESKK